MVLILLGIDPLRLHQFNDLSFHEIFYSQKNQKQVLENVKEDV